MQTMLGQQEFLDVLGRSGLIRPDLLKRIAADASARGTRPNETHEWAALLAREGYVTKFHLHHLLKKKWRGFFLQGKYKLLDLIGSGGMGKVFVAEHLLLRQLTAVKVLPLGQEQAPGMVERFHREALASISLNHPNIVRAFDVDRSGNLHYLVMEYVDGLDLEDLVVKHGYLSTERAANCIRQAALGLQHAHEAGWVHRDIKPGNLLLDRAGTVKLLDLGLARYGRGNDPRDNLTQNHMAAGAVLGTTNYLAPEQALSSEVDVRADIYSLGATLYFLLTGRPPFAEGSITQKLIWLQTQEPDAVRTLRPDIPAGLEDVLRKMMAKKREHRFAAPAEVAAALVPFAAPAPIPPSSKELPPSRYANLKLGAADMAVVAELARGGSSVSTASPHGPHDPTRMLPPPAQETRANQGTVTPAAGNFSSLSDNRRSGPRGESTAGDRSAGGYVPPTSAAAVGGFGVATPPTPALAPASSIASARDLSTLDAEPDILQESFEDEIFDTAQSQTSSWKLAAAIGLPALVALAMISQTGVFASRTQPAASTAVAPTGPAPAAVREPWFVVRTGDHPRFGGPRSFDSIAKAVAQALPGDRIRLLDPEVQEALVLTGSVPSGLIVEGDPGAPPVRWKTPAFKGDDAPMLDLRGVENLTVRHVVFQGSGESGPRTRTAVRIADRVPGVLLEDVAFEGYVDAGLRLEGATGDAERPLTLRRAEFRGGSSTPTRGDVRFVGPDESRRIRFDDVFFRGPTGAAFGIAAGSREVSLSNCRIYRADVGVRLEPEAAGKPLAWVVDASTWSDLTALIARPTDGPFSAEVELSFRRNVFNRVLRLERGDRDLPATWFAAGRDNLRDDLGFGSRAALIPARVAPLELRLDERDAAGFLSLPSAAAATLGADGGPYGYRP